MAPLLSKIKKQFVLIIVFCLLAGFSVVGIFPAKAQSNPVITGDLMQWHRVTLTWDGPSGSEATPTTFRDYRLLVTFSNGQGTYTVPGFFAADGDAANTGATSGNQWRVHFTPDAIGSWTYTASFRTGTNIAIDTNPASGTPTSFDGSTGTFNVTASTAQAPDFRYHGMLRYVNQHYLQFAGSGAYYLKAGADSPENFLAYADFDGTYDTGGVGDPFIHEYAAHAGDWQAGDPTWGVDERGKNIIGTINYLSGQGVNSIYFLTYNIDTGDGSDTWVWSDHTVRDSFDVSKLAQWDIVFSHMTARGMQLHVILGEIENDTLLGGDSTLNDIRKLYYRELIARFAHHPALQWNIGEENSNSIAEKQAFAAYIRSLDAYAHPIAVHTPPNDLSEYDDLLGDANYEATSIQGDAINYYDWAIEFRNRSAATGKLWVVYGDEQGPPVWDNLANLPDMRSDALWGNLMGGGAGVEWYFGYQTNLSDLFTEDFRFADALWEDSKHAIDFFQQYLPFAEMLPDNSVVTNGVALVKPNHSYAIFLADGGTTDLTLTDNKTYDVYWYNPRTGAALQVSNVSTIAGVGSHNLGMPPSQVNEDWAILVQSADNTDTAPTITPINDVSIAAGDSVTIAVDATDVDGNAGLLLDAVIVDAVDNIVDFFSFVDNGNGAGSLTIAPLVGDSGIYTAVISASDSVNAPTIATFSVSVSEGNAAPEFGELDPVPSYDTGETIEPYTLVASDPNQDALIFSAANLPEGLTIDAPTGVISGTITGAPDTYAVVLVVTDTGNPHLSDVHGFQWVIGDPNANNAPILMPFADQTHVQGDSVTIVVAASDEENDPLSYAASGLPAGLSIDAASGLISGIISAAPGTYDVTLSVSDNINAPVTQDFVWTVVSLNAPPLVADVEDQSTEQGQYVELQILATDADALSYAASGLPDGLLIDAATGLISGTVSASVGDYVVTVTVSDSNNPPVMVDFIWTITAIPVNLPPSVTQPADQNSVEGDIVSLQIAAIDPEAAALNYAASGLPAGLAIDVNTGLISGTISTGASTASPYAVTVTVSDTVHDTPTSFIWTVSEPVNLPPSVTPPNGQTHTEGNNVSLQIAASDPEAVALNYAASGLPAGLGINAATGLISGTISTGASAGSPYAVTVTVSDGVHAVPVNFNWIVNPVPAGPRVSHLSLVGVTTDAVVPGYEQLSDGMVISLSDFDSFGFNIIALTEGSVDKIEFLVDGATFRVEGVAPYALAGDSSGNYFTWMVTPGTYTVTAFPQNNPSGAVSVSLTITN